MIDLDALAGVVGLPAESAAVLAFRAVVALQRRFRPGVRLEGDVRGQAINHELRWRQTERAIANHEDYNRVTEEGAEAIALALAGVHCSWRVVRRLQSRLTEGADWLLSDPSSGSKVVLEVGGTDEGDLKALLAKKIDQAKRSPFSTRGSPAACVVRFAGPRALLWSDDGPR